MTFISHNGVAINLDLVSFIDFRKEGSATVHSGEQSYTFEGDDDASLRKRFPPAPAPKPALVVAEKTDKTAKNGKTDPAVVEPAE
jgi:hypothetical protein